MSPELHAGPTLTYRCTACGTAVFHAGQIVRETNLWDLGDYQAHAYLLDDSVDVSHLRRYDVSLHEGWYCCRFIAMRMTADKFGTGRALLVYKDSVTALEPSKVAASRSPAQPRLTARDFDAVVGDTRSDKLRVVKLGAIWCPPCRLMDAVIARIVESGRAPEVEFFEVDVDESPELAARFQSRSVPYTLFFHRGRRLRVQAEGLALLEGGIVGGLSQRALEGVLDALVAQVRPRG